MIEEPHGRIEIEGTFTFPWKETVAIKEVTPDLVEKEVISPEVLTEITTRLEVGETITEILNSLIEREVVSPKTAMEMINRMVEEGVITSEMARDIIASFVERGLIPPEIAAEVPLKPIPWGWIVAAGCLFVSGIICLSAKKDQGGKNA